MVAYICINTRQRAIVMIIIVVCTACLPVAVVVEYTTTLLLLMATTVPNTIVLFPLLAKYHTTKDSHRVNRLFCDIIYIQDKVLAAGYWISFYPIFFFFFFGFSWFFGG